MKTKHVEALMVDMKARAVEVARKAFNIELDYNDESVKQIEKILGKIHKDYKRTKNEEGLRGLALFFAAFIGEVIRRKGFGGKWQRHHPVIGDDTFPFQWRGKTLFLYAWCFKRIIEGKQDDVWIKYQTLVLNDIEKEAGVQNTI
jgi:hypothetical protein